MIRHKLAPIAALIAINLAAAKDTPAPIQANIVIDSDSPAKLYDPMNKLAFLTLVVLLLAPMVALHAADASARKPNIVFIYSDDQPLRAMSSQNPYFSTPNIDRLVKESVVFDNAFVTTSICAVSRASFFTGQHSVRNGIASFDTPLSTEQMKQSYAGLLRQAGYRTAFLGKYAIGSR